MAPARSSLPPWPAGKLLRLRGRVPTLEGTLSAPPIEFASNWMWSFTFPFPVRIGDEFAMSLPGTPHTRPLVSLENEGIFVDANPDKAIIDATFVGFLNDQGQLEAMLPQGQYEFGARATLTFMRDPKRVEIVADVVDGSGILVPSVNLAAIKTEQNLAEAVAQTDVARGIAATIDFPDWMWPHLIPCPDPVTRTLLVKNPSLPPKYASWAISYPSALRENPAMGMLLANTAYGSPLASAGADLRDKIAARLR